MSQVWTQEGSTFTFSESCVRFDIEVTGDRFLRQMRERPEIMDTVCAVLSSFIDPSLAVDGLSHHACQSRTSGSSCTAMASEVDHSGGQAPATPPPKMQTVCLDASPKSPTKRSKTCMGEHNCAKELLPKGFDWHSAHVALASDEHFQPMLIKLLREAKTEIMFCLYCLDDPVVVSELCTCAARGITVVGGVDRQQFFNGSSRSAPDAMEQLLRAQAQCCMLVDPKHPYASVHVKTWIIDQEYVTVGSHNGTKAAAQRNTEKTMFVKSSQLSLDMYTQLCDMFFNIREEMYGEQNPIRQYHVENLSELTEVEKECLIHQARRARQGGP
jgi:hypothetical protein